MLKNQDNVLPLSKNAKVLVAGPSAQSISALNGCWSYTWQGKDEQWYPADSKTILQVEAVKKGEVPRSRINDAVKRILVLKYKLGLFDDPYPEAAAKNNFGKQEYQVMALDAAREAMTALN